MIRETGEIHLSYGMRKEKNICLILGARKGEDKRKQTGRLVHFTSKDLKKWEFKGDFWAPGIYTMFEMPEIFKMGDWWYLVFSEYSEGNKNPLQKKQEPIRALGSTI